MSEMKNKAASRVARRAVKKGTMLRVAGEVRFIKDRGGDHNEWGWNPPGSSERTIDPDYKYKPANMKPLVQALRSGLMALGHCQSAYATFTKIKSQRVSPDGNLGGKGYVMPVKDLRKMLMNSAEALSAVTDTLYDEIEAPHWAPEIEGTGGDPRARGEVRQILDDVEEIREDPEEWAEDEEKEMDKDNDSGGKLASRLARKVDTPSKVFKELMAVDPNEIKGMASIFPEAKRLADLLERAQVRIQTMQDKEKDAKKLAHRYMAGRIV